MGDIWDLLSVWYALVGVTKKTRKGTEVNYS